MGVEQLVPLSTQAAAIFQGLVAEAVGDYLFPSGHTVKKGKLAVRPHFHEDYLHCWPTDGRVGHVGDYFPPR